MSTFYIAGLSCIISRAHAACLGLSSTRGPEVWSFQVLLAGMLSSMFFREKLGFDRFVMGGCSKIEGHEFSFSVGRLIFRDPAGFVYRHDGELRRQVKLRFIASITIISSRPGSMTSS